MQAVTFQGELLFIHITERGGQPMLPKVEARLVAGVGIDGDRYATGQGFYSKTPRADRQITLIEVETLEALARDHGVVLEPRETRRNLTVRAVPLNHLVGRRFRVGDCVLRGVRLNVPCSYLDGLTGKPLFNLLTHRSGLNCEIVEGGIVRPGDPVVPL